MLKFKNAAAIWNATTWKCQNIPHLQWHAAPQYNVTHLYNTCTLATIVTFKVGERQKFRGNPSCVWTDSTTVTGWEVFLCSTFEEPAVRLQSHQLTLHFLASYSWSSNRTKRTLDTCCRRQRGGAHPHSRSTPPTGSPDTACTPCNRNSSHRSAGTGTAPAHTQDTTKTHTHDWWGWNRESVFMVVMSSKEKHNMGLYLTLD